MRQTTPRSAARLVGSAVVVLALEAGCRIGYDVQDAGDRDAGAIDVGAIDVGTIDAGAIDVGAIDVGAIDVGVDASSTSPRCGDGVLDPGEACDGAALDGLACTTVAAGFRSGTLGCAADCRRFDTSACVAGDTITATTCELSDVAAAVARAADGDTVQVPAGTCTWSSPAPDTPALQIDDRNLVLRGAGEGMTTIVDEAGTAFGETLIVFGGSRAVPARVTGFTFQRSMNAEGSAHVIAFFGPRLDWRVDHCTFSMSSIHGAVHSDGTPSGLVDHVTLEGRAFVWVYGSYGDPDAIWAQPLGLGTRRAVYVEDARFDDRLGSAHLAAGAIYADYGARVVFRHNAVRDAPLGFQGPTLTRGSFSFEIYDNTFVAEVSTWVWASFGSGAGVVYGNRASGSWARFLALDYVRSCEASASAGLCDGTSTADGNVEATGYPCLDQPGRSTDGSSGQALEGIHAWDNADAAGAVSLGVNVGRCARMSDQVREGRDYFDGTPRPGYVAYPYPHPIALIEP
ncbi:MAG: hypothetical protein U0353_05990 [Sandaracinus sp.]